MEGSEVLRIAIWDEPRMKLFGAALDASRCVVTYGDRESVERGLLTGTIDLALVPPNRALIRFEDLDVLPAVAYSSWTTPHARLGLPGGLTSRPSGLSVRDEAGIEQLVSRIVLKEHYGMLVQTRVVEGSVENERDDAVLAIDEELPPGHMALDLGQEWYELTNYPMVWGVFAARKGEGGAAMVALLRDAAAAIETADELDGTDPGADGMGLPRFRLDDVAVASLTEFCTYLYFYGEIKDLQLLEPIEIAEAEDIGEDAREPLL